MSFVWLKQSIESDIGPGFTLAICTSPTVSILKLLLRGNYFDSSNHFCNSSNKKFLFHPTVSERNIKLQILFRLKTYITFCVTLTLQCQY